MCREQNKYKTTLRRTKRNRTLEIDGERQSQISFVAITRRVYETRKIKRHTTDGSKIHFNEGDRFGVFGPR